MSDYILHNIGLTVSPQLDLYQFLDPDKPVEKYPNYYLGKIIGVKGRELDINRTRRGGGEEHVPNCVLRNDDGIALIRIHNKEDYTIYNLPEASDNEIKDCVGVPHSSYPFAYVVVDYRDGKKQIAIEKTPAWDSKTTTIKKCMEEFFNSKLSDCIGITVTVKEKTISTKFEQFIDQRTIDYGDLIESFTFQYVNLKRNPGTRVPKELTEQMDTMSKVLEMYDAISGTTTMKMGTAVDNDKLKQLSTVVTMCSDNAFDLIVKFKNYGDYTCNEDIVAKYPMNDIVISNFKDFITPDIKTSDFDLRLWLDEMFMKVKGENYGEEIPTKPTR